MYRFRLTLFALLSVVCLSPAFAQTPLSGTLPPDPQTNRWRAVELKVSPAPCLDEKSLAEKRQHARFAPDTILAPPGTRSEQRYVWKMVLLIYPSVSIDQTVAGVTSHVTCTLTQAEIDTAISAMQSAQLGIYEGSKGEGVLSITTVIVNRTLTSLANFGDTYWPDCSITGPELQAYCAGGKADCAMVYWPSKDSVTGQQVSNGYWGLSYGAPASFTYGVGYSTVANIVSPVHSGYYPGEVFIHEWMHPTSDYYYQVWGVNVPNLDGAQNYRPCPTCPYYSYVQGDGYMAFYRDFLSGSVWNPAESRYEGLSSSAWRSGTPTNTVSGARDWQLYH